MTFKAFTVTGLNAVYCDWIVLLFGTSQITKNTHCTCVWFRSEGGGGGGGGGGGDVEFNSSRISHQRTSRGSSTSLSTTKMSF